MAGDGNDTIYGFNSTYRLEILAETYNSVVSGDDIVYRIGDGTITLKDARNKPLGHTVLGESGSSGGTSGSAASGGGNSSSTGSTGNSNSSNSSGGGGGGGSSGGGSGSSNSRGSYNNVNTVSSSTTQESSATSTPPTVIETPAVSPGEVIDRRGSKDFEAINGTNGADTIYAGDGGSQLWGGADNSADVLYGGGGADLFIGGKNQGSDTFRNVSTKDTINLTDVTLSDIVSAKDTNGFISLTFNTGNTLTIQSSELLSGTIRLADDTAHRFNHMTRTWQKG